MTNCPTSEKRAIETTPDVELTLTDVMEICSNMYLTHRLALEILGECEEFSELCEQSWIPEILSGKFPPFARRLAQIH